MPDLAPPIITVIKVTLDIRGRWAVGGPGGAGEEIKLPILMDPRATGGVEGRPFIPGTSLVGSLRRHLRPQTADLWLGPEPGEREQITGTLPRETEKRAGKLQVLGALPLDRAIGVRGTTAVDADRGAARDGTLRTEQWAEPTSVRILALHRGPRDPHFMEQLASWRPVLGRSRTSGMGRAVVSGLEAITLDLATDAHLGWWLFDRDEWLRGDGNPPTGVPVVDDTARATLVDEPALHVAFVVNDRIHVGSGGKERYQGRDVAQPVRSSHRLIIPGSSWKGIFRNRAKVALRAVGAEATLATTIIDTLFGAQGQRGRLSFDDSRTSVSVGAARTHVAIDRFTGGARPSALHTALAIPEGEQVALTVRTSGDDLPAPVRNLLLHIVADLHDGLIGIGRHSTRGYGTVRLENPGLVAQLAPLDPQELGRALASSPKEEPNGVLA